MQSLYKDKGDTTSFNVLRTDSYCLVNFYQEVWKELRTSY